MRWLGKGIRPQFLWTLLLLTGGALAILLPVSSSILDRQFNQFEHYEGIRDAQRIDLLLSQQKRALQIAVQSFGFREDLVQFVEHGDPEFLNSNINEEFFSNLNIDFLFVLNTRGQARYIGEHAITQNVGADSSKSIREPDPVVAEALLRNPSLRTALSEGHAFAGYFFDGQMWYLAASSPISSPRSRLKPGETASVVGVLGFVRRLDAFSFAKLSEEAQIGFKLTPPDGQLASEPVLSFVGNDMHIAFDLINPKFGEVANIQAIKRRSALNQLRTTKLMLLFNALGLLSLAMLLAWMFIDRRIVSRILSLGNSVGAFRAGESFDVALSANNDEIDHLASSFTHMYQDLERVNAQWKLEATHDSLTGLRNRAQLAPTIDQLLENNQINQVTLLLADLSGFRVINDVYGQDTGDRLLSRIGDQVCKLATRDIFAFRSGGDEFALVVRNACDPSNLAADLAGAVYHASHGERFEGKIEAAIGYVTHQKSQGFLSASELINRANLALKKAKDPNVYHVVAYNKEIHEEQTEKIELQQSLRIALRDRKLEVVFQPIVCAQSGRALRLEALARWHDAVRGEISPTQFVTIAEQAYLTTDLDLQVVQTAIEGLMDLWTQFPGLGLSFNASVQSLLDTKYPGRLIEIVQATGVPPSALRLEVTETALASNENALQLPLTRIIHAGLEVELDDFGVGYSSLARLAALKPAGLKLDGSFVRGIERGGARVCRAIIEMAHHLGIEVTAECVETDSQRQFLKAAGCAELQGFYFAKPMALAELKIWLDENLYQNKTADQ